jgi:hypothetical protein
VSVSRTLPGVRQRALLAFSVPLAAVGCLAGHAAGYAAFGMSHRDRLVHGYLSYAPQFLAACVAFLALALALRVTGRLQGRPAAWPFALLPPLAFVAQELIERLVAGLPAHAVLEPPVYAGLAAQLPVAALAYLAARALVRVADAAARALVPAPSFTLRPAPLLVPAGATPFARTALAFDRLGRAPPR